MSSEPSQGPARDKVRAHRARLRQKGLRPVQFWVPDMRSTAFAAEAHRQSALVAASAQAAEDQAFVDALAEPWGRVRRGEIWTASGGDYAGKPQPVVIVQGDRFDASASITVCRLTTDPTDAPLFRPLVEPSAANGLHATSRLMADKITTVARAKLGQRIGELGDEATRRLDRAMLVFLGLVR